MIKYDNGEPGLTNSSTPETIVGNFISWMTQ